MGLIRAVPSMDCLNPGRVLEMDVTLRAHSSLSTGTYTITLALVDPTLGTMQGQPVVVERVRMSQSPCAFPVPISLRGALAGVYGLAVGVYDPETIEWLSVVSESGDLWPDDRLVWSAEMTEVEKHRP